MYLYCKYVRVRSFPTPPRRAAHTSAVRTQPPALCASTTAMAAKLEHRESMLRAYEQSQDKTAISAVARAEEHANHMKLLESALKVLSAAPHAWGFCTRCAPLRVAAAS